MKRQTLLIVLVIATTVLSACASTSTVTPTPASLAAAYIQTDFTDAASVRNQLAYGTIKLEGTTNAVTSTQAQTLLPLWQAVLKLSGTSEVATEELTAVQNQITEAMSPTQMQTIGAMKISNATLSTFYAERGVTLPTPAPNVTKVSGGSSGVSQADKEATRNAATALGTPMSSSGAGQTAKTLLFEAVVQLLTTRAKG
ncbi:MAG: hypothetical protein HZB17_03010 [Chloroflexi bacterium]|nr:hypothetical protein [Chloroflexota bacterium]MBI5080262.1 hypothetical protein [Chloroflexota bacterium]MBI5349185.1 hypothetical protein [Chloroflexota bacterium]